MICPMENESVAKSNLELRVLAGIPGIIVTDLGNVSC